jgi:hypothetical protein
MPQVPGEQGVLVFSYFRFEARVRSRNCLIIL